MRGPGRLTPRQNRQNGSRMPRPEENDAPESPRLGDPDLALTMTWPDFSLMTFALPSLDVELPVFWP